MSRDKAINRRRFLQNAAAGASAIVLPYIVPASALGKNGAVAPSNRITMASIGTGNMGGGNMAGFMAEPDVQFLAVCDIDARRLQKATKNASLPPNAAYNDFREILSRDDVDAVIVATPDHWHVPISIAAVKAGMDIYCEKPLSLTIAQGRALCDAVRIHGRVFQTGSQQRSEDTFHFASSLATKGYIGDLRIIRVGLPGSRTIGPQPAMAVPKGFDYDMWLGPAPWQPYTTARCHGKFRHMFDYSGGKFIDWGAHHLDIVQMALGADNSGPVEITGRGTFPDDGIYDTAVSYSIDYTYADGSKVNASTSNKHGILFEGTKGWVHVNRGFVDAHPKSLLKIRRIKRYHRQVHRREFLDCIKLRKDPIAPAEVGHRSATVCHLGNIAMLLGRKLNWDPKSEQFINDPQANRMKIRPMRAPWHL